MHSGAVETNATFNDPLTPDVSRVTRPFQRWYKFNRLIIYHIFNRVDRTDLVLSIHI